MGIVLVGLSVSAVQKVALDAGVLISEEDAREIAEADRACLSEYGRVLFGESAALRLLRELATSPYLTGDCIASMFTELTEVFYELRNDFTAAITDAEIVLAIRDAFDDSAGDVGMAMSQAYETLSQEDKSNIYEIIDDDGNRYRWDPNEWHDDVMADGWYGERLEDIDE